MRLPLTLIALALLPLGAAADDFHPLPLGEAIDIVSNRYEGRLIAAQLVPPRPPERDLGAALVHALRLVTPAGDVLAIRLDARTGRFLEVAGRGQIAARK